MSNKDTPTRRIAITIFFVLVVSLIVLNSNSLKNFSLPTQPQNTPVPQSDSIELPFSINKPYLGMVILVYNFFGPVKEIKSLPEGSQLILDIEDDNLPSFIIEPNITQIFRSEDNKPVSASLSDIKVGQNITIQAMYDLKLSIWRVIRVDIF